MIRWERDTDGVVTLTMDDPAKGANTMNDTYVSSMQATLDRLDAESDSVRGVILTSAKKSFFAGGDLDLLRRATPDMAAEIFANIERVKAQLRRLEKLGRPVVAAINGSALGGGLELALACHRRIVADNPRTEIGLPEVTLGLLPGGGGVVRTVRLLGLMTALTEVLLRGQRHRAAKALELGLVHEIVPAGELLARAKEWILSAEASPRQPWDTPGYKVPGGTPSTPALAMNLPAFPANLRKELKGAPYPAPRNILAAAVEGLQVDFDTALRIESRYLVSTMTGQVAKNMIQAFFFDMQEVSNRPRPEGHQPATDRVGVAGMMTRRYTCAPRQACTWCSRTSPSGRRTRQGLLTHAAGEGVKRGRSTRSAAASSPVSAAADPADLAARGGDRGVFEDPRSSTGSPRSGVVADSLLPRTPPPHHAACRGGAARRTSSACTSSPVDKCRWSDHGRRPGRDGGRALDLVARIRKPDRRQQSRVLQQ
jgi:3-hydroxyacyl-CoA dehydrogenase/enoyl-CoA hydratase/3-hydroxybutyryl-CoA epimerase